MRKNSSHTEKVLNVWAIVLLVWSLYRWKFRTELPLFVDELIAKPIIFIVPLYIFIKKFEKKHFFSSLGLYFKHSPLEILLGILVGSIFFLAGLLNVGKLTIPMDISLAGLAGIALATSISEEILSRGFVLNRLYEKSRNIYTSSFFSSMLFFFLHVPILFTLPSISGGLLIKVMFTDLILSFAVSFVFLLRGRNLIMPILIHALYTLSLYLFI